MINFRNMVLLAIASCAGLAWASESELRNKLLQQDGWVGYRVPLVAGSGSSCCYSDTGGDFRKQGCDLDERHGSFVSERSGSGTSSELSVYWHVANGKADQIRAYSADCPVTSGKPVRWVESVDPVDSIGNISGWVQDKATSPDSASNSVPAIALHADEEATAALIRLAGPGSTNKLREESIFWLGQARGERGADYVERVATSDPSDKMREHAVFALSQTGQKDAYKRVLGISKLDTSADVRGKALFWMAQMDDPRAQVDILAALDKETSDEVREQAVFALSQLDEKIATTALISVIRGNYPRSVKEKALFWLGEAGTDEALSFIDEVLTR